MHLELISTNEVVLVQVLLRTFSVVVTVVDFDLKDLLLLKVIINSDFPDELRTPAIMNHLSFAKFLPLTIDLLEKYYKGI